jgi:hypothetical protein
MDRLVLFHRYFSLGGPQNHDWQSYFGLICVPVRLFKNRKGLRQSMQRDPTLLKRQPMMAFHGTFRFIVRSCAQFLLGAAPADM